MKFCLCLSVATCPSFTWIVFHFNGLSQENHHPYSVACWQYLRSREEYVLNVVRTILIFDMGGETRDKDGRGPTETVRPVKKRK